MSKTTPANQEDRCGTTSLAFSDGQKHRGDRYYNERRMQNKLVQVREAVTWTENDFQGRQGQHPQRPAGTKPETEETITGRERRGGESMKSMRELPLPGRTKPRIRLQKPTSARRRRKANLCSPPSTDP